METKITNWSHCQVIWETEIHAYTDISETGMRAGIQICIKELQITNAKTFKQWLTLLVTAETALRINLQGNGEAERLSEAGAEDSTTCKRTSPLC